ncbi:class I SAM-dependent methyltransferase [Catellatospora sp. NPDC049133]|uniref:class I SAM-dependent methyltransferase n=1 Tax=Catellatospora sp. NPDC049133 TaxID=3155499 RepID=UPI0033F0D78B
MGTAPANAYMFDNTTNEAATQVRLLAEILDPHSIGVLESTGIRPGLRCLDAGPGAGTISYWLAQQVGPAGHVTALDIAPVHITQQRPNLTVRADDIRTAELEPNSLDLIHARLLLMHLPERKQVLARLAQALVPGGRIVISDWDCTWHDMVRASPDAKATDLFHTFQKVLLGLGTSRGADMHWAADANQAMRDCGLVDVATVTHSQTWTGGTGVAMLHHSNSIQLQDHLVAAGMEVDELIALRDLLRDPELVLSDYLMHTTVGRRPIAG